MKFRHQLAHEYSTKAGVDISEEETKRKYEGTMAKIDVYFRSRKRLVIEEVPKYKVTRSRSPPKIKRLIISTIFGFLRNK